MTEEGALRGHRRSGEWTRVGHGLYRRHGVSDLHAWQLVLPPTGRLTHLSAAAARGWWLPPLPHGLPAFAAVNRCSTRPERAGLHVVRSDAVVAAREEGGLRLDPPGEVLLACARDLELVDLLVLADSALHKGDCSKDEIAAAATPGRKGARLLRQVVDLCDARAESPWETILRLLHVTCGVEVEPQHEIRTAEDGFVARADLLLTGTRTIHEYDGEVHLTREQQQADLERSRRLAAAEVVRRGYTSYDVLRRPVTVLRDADLATGRDHDPGRIRAWNRLLAGSLLTPSGRQRLMSRLASPRRAPSPPRMRTPRHSPH
jgi:very-short-patch-repair endonuclease